MILEDRSINLGKNNLGRPSNEIIIFRNFFLPNKATYMNTIEGNKRILDRCGGYD